MRYVCFATHGYANDAMINKSPTLVFDGVGDEAFAIVDVPDVDLFVFTNIGSFKQVFVDGAGALVWSSH